VSSQPKPKKKTNLNKPSLYQQAAHLYLLAALRRIFRESYANLPKTGRNRGATYGLE